MIAPSPPPRRPSVADPPGRSPPWSALIAQLAAAMNARALYTATHPSVRRTATGLIDALTTACEDRGQDSVTFLLVGEELVVDGRALRRRGPHQQPVVRMLRRRGIERLTLARGLELGECETLVTGLATGSDLRSTPHVILRASGAAGPARRGGRAGGDADGRDVEATMDAFLRFRSEGAAAVDVFEDLVWTFMDLVTRTAHAVLPAVPLKAHDEYTFIHSVNVSLLVLAQARALGFEGQLLHAIGLAALLHDVGKLSVPLTVLNKPGKLEGEDWRVMMSHAELGAWQLCQLERSAPLSILVAYEHHLRFDGQQNYPLLRVPRQPTLASQLTAIADVYDAICTVRPYRRALSREAALDVIRSRAGSFHDPYLVGNFVQLVAPG